jgi:hypothetical protein
VPFVFPSVFGCCCFCRSFVASLMMCVIGCSRVCLEERREMSSLYVGRCEREKELESFRVGRRAEASLSLKSVTTYSLETMSCWNAVDWDAAWQQWRVECGLGRGVAGDVTQTQDVKRNVVFGRVGGEGRYVPRFDAVTGKCFSGTTVGKISSQLRTFEEALKSSLSSSQVIDRDSVEPRKTTWGAAALSEGDPPLPLACPPSRASMLSTMALNCPFWLFPKSGLEGVLSLDAHADAKRRMKPLTSVFPGVVACVEQQSPADISYSSHLKFVDIPLYVSLACLCEDHRHDFYRAFPLRSNCRSSSAPQPAAAKNRHVLFRDNAFVYVHERAENNHLSQRHSPAYNTYAWVPIQELVSQNQQIVANLSVHEDDAAAVRRVAQALAFDIGKKEQHDRTSGVAQQQDLSTQEHPGGLHCAHPGWTRVSQHFSLTSVPDVLQHLTTALENQSASLNMMGETKTCFVVPPLTSRGDAGGVEAARSVEHLLPLAYFIAAVS